MFHSTVLCSWLFLIRISGFIYNFRDMLKMIKCISLIVGSVLVSRGNSSKCSANKSFSTYFHDSQSWFIHCIDLKGCTQNSYDWHIVPARKVSAVYPHFKVVYILKDERYRNLLANGKVNLTKKKKSVKSELVTKRSVNEIHDKFRVLPVVKPWSTRELRRIK